MVPALPAVVVRIEIVSPARIDAVRPESVVMRGSASTRPLPFWMSRFSCALNEIGVRESAWKRPRRAGVPSAFGSGCISENVVLTAAAPSWRPRSLATFSSSSRISVSSTTSGGTTSTLATLPVPCARWGWTDERDLPRRRKLHHAHVWGGGNDRQRLRERSGCVDGALRVARNV